MEMNTVTIFSVGTLIVLQSYRLPWSHFTFIIIAILLHVIYLFFACFRDFLFVFDFLHYNVEMRDMSRLDYLHLNILEEPEHTHKISRF